MFAEFAHAVAARWLTMSEHTLLRTDVVGDELWGLYLASFPEGTNPLFRVRTIHDGSYDKNFIRQVGGLVIVGEDNQIQTLWDLPGLPEPYATVAKTLGDRVRQAAITGVFFTKEHQFGHARNYEYADGAITNTFDHFLVRVQNKNRSNRPEAAAGERNSAVAVFLRGVETITPAALQTILELIDSNSLYRGAEFRQRVVQFLSAVNTAQSLTPKDRSRWVWTRSPDDFRNTVIGTLAVDLSEGVELEKAVRSFEAKVAPANYKRPKALVTEAMITSAMATINELGVEASLARRHAALSDISVNDVLWVGNDSRKNMKGGVEDLLRQSVVVTGAKGTKVSFSDFLRSVVPGATKLELLFTNSLSRRLMSMTAPVDPNAPPLFKWNNGLSWSYTGDVTDSIKERVKKAGGSVVARHRVSLAWFNTDDLDIHYEGPLGHIYFGNKAGVLDVDMNAGGPNSKEPVENLAFSRFPDGVHKIVVNNYNKRNTEDGGFVLEVESDGVLKQFSSSQHLRAGENVTALLITTKGDKIVSVTPDKSLTGQGISKTVWGINTESYIPVETVLHSPNHWDGQSIGNQHVFFILEGCRNPEPVRGIYNEYLTNALSKHGRVFELLGSKTKAPYSDQQLSGVGFSVTNGDDVTVRVNGGPVYTVTL